MSKRITQFTELSPSDLVTKLTESKAELFNLRFQSATGQLENNARIRTLRKDVARINMVLRSQEIAAAERLALAGK